MSEYRWDDPVEVLWDGVWQAARYGEVSHSTDGRRHRVLVLPTGDYKAMIQSFADDRIRPRSVPLRTGWRLPEPGDVVMLKGNRGPYTIKNVSRVGLYADGGPNGVLLEGVDARGVSVVRLHDAPAAAPEPVKTVCDASVDGVDLRQLMEQVIKSALQHPADSAVLHRFALQTVQLLLAEVKVKEVTP